MIIVLVQLSLPVLAAFGIQKIISLKYEKDIRAEKILHYAAIVFSGIFVATLFLNSAIKDWFAERIATSEKSSDYLKAFSGYASEMFLGDALIAFALIALTFWLAYAYINSKLSKDLFVTGIIIFTIFDLWRIDNRGAEYIDYKDMRSTFNEPPYISIIKRQNDKEPFRILNIKQDRSVGSFSQNSNYNAYFLVQDLYGYSGIKPRAYQDIIDILGSPVNPTLWRMLNTKYIITERAINYPALTFVDSTSQNVVYRTNGVLPRAYFVNRVEVKPMLEVLNEIKNNQFDPKDVAFIEEGNIKIDKPDSTTFVKITSYKDEKISIDAKASGNNFLFLGDTFFPNGWNAYVDGKETTIYRVNHGFRGVIVPKGEHKIEFIYAPKSFFVSKYIALSLSSLIIIGLIFGIFLETKKRRSDTSVNKF